MNKSVRIMVVEDSATQAENIRYILQQQGYQVDVALNGEQALKMIGGNLPTVVISDIIMPEMDGFQLCRKIKSDKKLAAIPIILLTALSDPEDVLRGLACGADHFITKPYDEKHLLSKIHDILNNDEMHSDLSIHKKSEFCYKGKKYVITSGQRQILNLLLSTYELAVIKNHELEETQQELESLNEHLERKVNERTADLAKANQVLTKEIAEHRKAEETLQRSREQLRFLASKILTAQEDERKQVAREVHDVLGSSLSAIKYKVEGALYEIANGRAGDIAKSLEAVVPLIKETMEEARRIQSDLRPPLLDNLGIVATFSWFCRRFESIYSQIHVEQQILLQEEEVPDHLKIALFRITQEAMNNIGKHAKADQVHLGLQKTHGTIELTIRDNGKGFDQTDLPAQDSSKRGLGLSSMKERVEFLGGFFSLDSARGKGTTIRAVWPIGKGS